jgi:hypothetical protein
MKLRPNWWEDYPGLRSVYGDDSSGKLATEWRAAQFVTEQGRVYRYDLRRCWDPDGPEVLFIGLNPSKADHMNDDQTVRLWRGFAKRWGYGGFQALNVYNVVATNPREILTCPVKIQDMGRWRELLVTSAKKSALTVACWGAHCSSGNAAEVRRLLTDNAGVRVYAMGLTQYGTPRHPRGVSAESTPILLWDRSPEAGGESEREA